MSEEREDNRETRPAEAETVGETTQQNKPRRTGRPTICTSELAEEIAGYIRQYGFVELSVNLAGLSKPAFYEWLDRGETDIANGDETTPHAVFANAIKKARAEFQAGAATVINEGKQGWQSRAWMLERSDPEQYAVRNRVEHSGHVDTGATPVLTPSEWDDRRRAILGERDAAGPN